MLMFENPQYFWLFWFLPVLLVLFILSQYVRKRNMGKFGNTKVVKHLTPFISKNRPWLKHIFLLLVFSFLTMALINPKVGSRMEEATREGVDIIVALDVSKSMLAEDIRPNRLERAKIALSGLIDKTGNDRIGIVAFAGNAVTQVPLTTDKFAAKMILQTINTNSVSVQGTAIGKAIKRAARSFNKDDASSKVIIILSDGEGHADDPVAAAKNAAEKNITIHTIGIGTTKGAPIPIYQNGEMTGYIRDEQGNTVITRYDEQTLKNIANATNGIFLKGNTADLGLNEVLEHINEMEKKTYDEIVFADYESKYHYFIALALIFLFIELMIFERKNKHIEKIKKLISYK